MSRALAITIAAHTLLAVALGIRVALIRMNLKQGVGDGGHKELIRAIRVHANLVEWVPLVLLTLFAAEARGAREAWIAGLGGALFLARLAHAWGLSHSGGVSPGRRYGVLTTAAVALVAAALAIFGGGPAGG